MISADDFKAITTRARQEHNASMLRARHLMLKSYAHDVTFYEGRVEFWAASTVKGAKQRAAAYRRKLTKAREKLADLQRVWQITDEHVGEHAKRSDCTAGCIHHPDDDGTVESTLRAWGKL